jgi:hypothetical protein
VRPARRTTVLNTAAIIVVTILLNNLASALAIRLTLAMA